MLLVAAWYAGNTLYNIYNKKATNTIYAHWVRNDESQGRFPPQT